MLKKIVISLCLMGYASTMYAVTAQQPNKVEKKVTVTKPKAKSIKKEVVMLTPYMDLTTNDVKSIAEIQIEIQKWYKTTTFERKEDLAEMYKVMLSLTTFIVVNYLDDTNDLLVGQEKKDKQQETIVHVYTKLVSNKPLEQLENILDLKPLDIARELQILMNED